MNSIKFDAYLITIMNMKNVISTTKAPAAIGPYSQAVRVGNLVFTSGQIPINPATGVFAEGGIKEQTRQSLLNVEAILEAAGLTMSDVVKTTVFMADMNDFCRYECGLCRVLFRTISCPFGCRSKSTAEGCLSGEIEVVAGV